ncbi:MAG: DinB family protein [Bacteroidota bacterium]
MTDRTAALFADLDVEIESTRRILSAVPWDQASWRPHERSMPLGSLAIHVATLPAFGTQSLQSEGVDMADLRRPPASVESTDDLVATWEGYVGTLRDALSEAADEHLDGTWTLTAGGHTLSAAPRHLTVRRWTLNHLIHHRGQLTVYLRLLGVPVPGVYGPSADDRLRATS